MTVFAMLPAFNEKKNLPALLVSLNEVFLQQRQVYRIIIVNDGSTDGTLRTLDKFKRKFNLRIVTHEKNLGLGQALKTGLQEVLKKAGPKDIVLTMDADNTHDVSAIPSMIQKIKSGYDLVLASRFVTGGGDEGLTITRKILSHAAGLIFQLLFPIKGVREYTCSYRAFSVSLLKKGFARYGDDFVKEKGFNCMLEILVKLAQFKPRIIEVPFTLYYHRKKGESKMDVRKTILRYGTIIMNRKELLGS